jgi:dienelactone hydrolase
MKPALNLAILAAALSIPGSGFAAADPFTPFLNSKPATTATLSQDNYGTGAQAITIRTFTYPSRNAVNTVYAIHGQPQAAGKYPGILILHGGGGNAETVSGYVTAFAQRGYVALAVDLPGIAGTTNTPHTIGPWKSRPLGEAPRFEVVPGPEKSTLVDAEVAGLEAFNWLRAQTNVDSTAMGITGFSWGGYSTTFLSGLMGSKVKAAYAVYGCGFYEKGSFWKTIIANLSAADRDVWLANLDAGRRAPNMKAAYFLEAASNDTYFWPEAVAATINAVPGAAKNHVWGPNYNHKQMPSGGAMQRYWFDYHLKGTGSAFSKVSIAASEPVSGKGRKITIAVALAAGTVLDSVRLQCSPPAANWQSRVWTSVKAQAGNVAGTYTASIPDSLADKLVDYYAMATDSRGVATGSLMYNTSQTVSLARPSGAVKEARAPERAAVKPVTVDGRRLVTPKASNHLIVPPRP